MNQGADGGAVILRYFASVKAAAGVAEERVAAGTLAAALAAARGGRDSRFADVLAVCSYVVDGRPVGSRDPASVVLADDSVVECLPPFAGG